MSTDKIIYLRKPLEKDAYEMLKMLNNPDIKKYFSFFNHQFTMQDVKCFIQDSNKNKFRVDFSIVDEEDKFLGTITLKNIDQNKNEAEYAISLSEKSIGKGVAKKATDIIISKAIIYFNIKTIYLNVKNDNTRAIRFYEKYGFKKYNNKRDLNSHSLTWFKLNISN
mgnify:CR=1 FL=1